ncbi:MAG: peroxide stress protein YaaA [Limosilactobacillus gorillae]|jgi:uncharacterized protein|uniref:peroxide stress protein YaaA n=1 Tax=Limosilactobacillus gorillae TaxID=1450649 RepID=UPI000AD5572C|nr:peroxide stress protein YaaA [Limosilactobacillus gorillae]MDO4855443.1 peroxide stress protein YaaA [Limosilactobacillus gorillae]
MKIVISPAKQMAIKEDVPVAPRPIRFTRQVAEIMADLKGRTPAQLQKLWKCSDRLTNENFIRVQSFDLAKLGTPAVMAYTGIQYQSIGAEVLTDQGLINLDERLYILSGLYGLLGAFDGILPYRLEMGAKGEIAGKKDLYHFWGACLYQALFHDQDLVLNLTSKEYGKAIIPYLTPGDRWVTALFKQNKNGRLVQQATAVKQARGSMVRYLALQDQVDLAYVQGFTVGGYAYHPELSKETELVFVKD